MKKIAFLLAFLAVTGLVGQAFAEPAKCEKGYHHNKKGECIKNKHSKHWHNKNKD